MLRSLKDLERYKVSATDGEVGFVRNFLVDDERWVVRYLVVETGSFFSERQVLITPISFRKVDWSTHRFHLSLTVDKINASPGVDVDQSVSRQHERDYYRYFGYPYYWGYTGVWGMGYYPSELARKGWIERPIENRTDHPNDDVHLRSVRDVCGYDIRGTDGAIGCVADLIVDDENWQVRYLVVDTGHWWLGKKVLVSPEWAEQVSWEERAIHLNLSRQAIKASPTWDPATAVNREYETHLCDYYGRPSYWAGDEQPVEITQPQENHPG